MIFYTKLLHMTNRRLTQAIELTEQLNPQLFVDATRRLKRRFINQRNSCKYRGVEFRMSFEDWRDWWLASGHVDERGKLRGQWVMARRFDAGAYELGNIECKRAEDNVSERNSRCYPGEYD